MKRIILFFLAALIALAAFGCDKTPDQTTADTTEGGIPWSTFDMPPPEVIAPTEVTFRPTDESDELTLTLTLADTLPTDFGDEYIYNVDLSRGDEWMQSFTINTTYSLAYVISAIEFDDLDFDGSRDLMVTYVTGSVNRVLSVYRYDDAGGSGSGGFVAEPFFSFTASVYTLIPENKTIVIQQHDSALLYTRQLMKYDGSTYTLLRDESAEIIGGEDPKKWTVRVTINQIKDGEKTEIFTADINEDEYIAPSGEREDVFLNGV